MKSQNTSMFIRSLEVRCHCCSLNARETDVQSRGFCKVISLANSVLPSMLSRAKKATGGQDLQ